MDVTTKTEAEIQPTVLLPGVYDAAVRATADKISKAGNDMIELSLAVWGNDGDQSVVFDYLLDAMKYKLRHFCFAVGLDEAYNSGELTAEMCQGHEVRVSLRIDAGNGEWPRTNKVIDYMPLANTAGDAAVDTADDAVKAVDTVEPAQPPEPPQPESVQSPELVPAPF